MIGVGEGLDRFTRCVEWYHGGEGEGCFGIWGRRAVDAAVSFVAAFAGLFNGERTRPRVGYVSMLLSLKAIGHGT